MKLFQLAEKQSSLWIEARAALASFFAMAYLFILCSQWLSQTGMDFGAVFTAMLVIASATTLFMGLIANYPFALAPNIALAAFFTYGVVGQAGFTWQMALGACLCAGIILLLLNAFHLRETIVHAIPAPLRFATAGGIGLFLIAIGLKSIGLLTSHASTWLEVGTFSKLDLYLAALGLLITAALQSRRVIGAYFIGMILICLIALFLGRASWHGWYAYPSSLAPTWLKFDLQELQTLKALPIIITFVLVSLFDTAATLLGFSEQARFLEGKGKLLKPDGGLYADPVGTIAGACLGSSPVTPVPEAAAGISAGGRSGLTALFLALLFALAIFLAPLAASVPYFATAPILIIAGAALLQHLKKVNWYEPTDAIPALLLLLAIPLTSNIATGLTLGFTAYPVVKLAAGRIKEISWMVWLLAILFALSYLFS